MALDLDALNWAIVDLMLAAFWDEAMAKKEIERLDNDK